MKELTDQRVKNMKVIQEKMNLDQKEMKRFNPVSSYTKLNLGILTVLFITLKIYYLCEFCIDFSGGCISW